MQPRATEPACYEESASFCRWVYTTTGNNEALAGVADWFVDRPLKVLLVILVAFVANRLVKRAINRAVPRMVNPSEPAVERLERLGIDVPNMLARSVKDPRREARSASITAALTSTVSVVIWVIALLMVFGVIGIQLGPLIAGAGIAGVALGFGAQSLVKDTIAGLFMLVEDQYGIGDVVDLGEAVGVVEEVALRTTVLRGVDGTVWHVPNGVVQRVGNMSQLWSVAVLDVDVAYQTDLGMARALFHRAATEVCEREEFVASIIETPVMLGVESLGADGVTLRLTIKVEPGTQWALQRALREHVKTVFDEASIEIPFPQRVVWSRVEPT